MTQKYNISEFCEYESDYHSLKLHAFAHINDLMMYQCQVHEFKPLGFKACLLDRCARQLQSKQYFKTIKEAKIVAVKMVMAQFAHDLMWKHYCEKNITLPLTLQHDMLECFSFD